MITEKLVAYILDGTKTARTHDQFGNRSARKKSRPEGTHFADTLYYTGYSDAPYVIVVEPPIAPVR